MSFTTDFWPANLSHREQHNTETRNNNNNKKLVPSTLTLLAQPLKSCADDCLRWFLVHVQLHNPLRWWWRLVCSIYLCVMCGHKVCRFFFLSSSLFVRNPEQSTRKRPSGRSTRRIGAWVSWTLYRNGCSNGGSYRRHDLIWNLANVSVCVCASEKRYIKCWRCCSASQSFVASLCVSCKHACLWTETRTRKQACYCYLLIWHCRCCCWSCYCSDCSCYNCCSRCAQNA